MSPRSNVRHWDDAQLWKSVDYAASWIQTDVRFTYDDHGIGSPAILNFGRDYAGARDTFIYSYWTVIKQYIWEEQRPGEILLSRVHRQALEDQSAYRFLAGFDSKGEPLWGDLEEASPVFADTNGVMRNSAVYNPGLNRYLLVTNHTQRNRGNLAMFDAPEPWGPLDDGFIRIWLADAR